jgi:hypothetical protein
MDNLAIEYIENHEDINKIRVSYDKYAKYVKDKLSYVVSPKIEHNVFSYKGTQWINFIKKPHEIYKNIKIVPESCTHFTRISIVFKNHFEIFHNIKSIGLYFNCVPIEIILPTMNEDKIEGPIGDSNTIDFKFQALYGPFLIDRKIDYSIRIEYFNSDSEGDISLCVDKYICIDDNIPISTFSPGYTYPLTIGESIIHKIDHRLESVSGIKFLIGKKKMKYMNEWIENIDFVSSDGKIYLSFNSNELRLFDSIGDNIKFIPEFTELEESINYLVDIPENTEIRIKIKKDIDHDTENNITIVFSLFRMLNGQLQYITPLNIM